MFLSRLFQVQAKSRRYVRAGSRLLVIVCCGSVLAFAADRSDANRPGTTTERRDDNSPHRRVDRKPRRQREHVKSNSLASKRPSPTENDKSARPPVCNDQPVAIFHGLQVGPDTVGLSPSGARLQQLELVTGGKASALANAVDPATGRPMLTMLDIAGQLTIDVPCVIDRCRVTQVGGLYCIRNSPMFDFEARNCEFEAAAAADGTVAQCVVLNARTLRRCIIKGGRDGIKLASVGGCLIEDCWIYDQISGDGSHCDSLQMVKGQGDWDTWVIRRCRFEGPWQRQTSAIILQADTGDLTGVTVENCFLSGGTYTLYTRAKTNFTISKIRIVGNIWANESWKFGPHSNECTDLDLRDNWVAPVTSNTSPITVNAAGATSLSN